MNSQRPHVLVLPEDDANRHLANGFFKHHNVKIHNYSIGKPLGGWEKVRDYFKNEQIAHMRNFPHRTIVLLVDFDNNTPVDTTNRLAEFIQVIPSDLRDRVFILGTWDEPQKLPMPHGEKGLETHGFNLANDCYNKTWQYWSASQLRHNLSELNLNNRLERLNALIF